MGDLLAGAGWFLPELERRSGMLLRLIFPRLPGCRWDRLVRGSAGFCPGD